MSRSDSVARDLRMVRDLAAPVSGRVLLVECDVEGVPVTQGSTRLVGARFSRARVTHEHAAALRLWRRQVSAAVAAAALVDEPWDGPVRVEVVFYLERSQTSVRLRRALPSVKPDLDKLARAVLDALAPRRGSGLLVEDSRVVELAVSKRFGAACSGAPATGVTLRVYGLRPAVSGGVA
ncbi:MAG: RusA family crossover junction endodeoxyribonuclease [Buchananella hordeovulneris]|nr:RusA family crossover junction endodeoxyribonuclease [Buchananella hordeovulneris]